MIRSLFVAFLGLAFVLGSTPPNARADEQPRRLLLLVTENDKAKMDMVLSNAANVSSHYLEQGDEVEIEIVAYGPGLHMLRADTSPVKQRVLSFTDNFPNVKFIACGNTMTTIKRKTGKDVPLVPNSSVVKAGVVHLLERQDEGWAYVRP